MTKFLDIFGLQTLWGKIKNYIAAQGFLTSHQSLANYVTLDGEQAITGKKTLTNVDPASTIAVATGTTDFIRALEYNLYNSPFAKYVWHDWLSFIHLATSSTITQESTTDGSTWSADNDLHTSLFSGLDKTNTVILDDTICGRRYTFQNSNVGYNNTKWLYIGTNTSSNMATLTIVIEVSSDGETWTRIGGLTGVKATSDDSWGTTPILIPTTSPTGNRMRITITRPTSETTKRFVITSIKWLTKRAGCQGFGRENEFPYQFDENGYIFPWKNNAQYLGSSTYKWARVYATTFYGALSGIATGANTIAASNVGDYTNAVAYGMGGKDIASCYEGSSPDRTLWSYPKGGTKVSSSAANILCLRMYWSNKYWFEIFKAPTVEHIYVRSVVNGVGRDWYIIPRSPITSNGGRSVGSTTQPVYINDGIVTPCDAYYAVITDNEMDAVLG